MIVDILDANTQLTKDVDLFYLEMPLDKAGCWVSERQIDSNNTGQLEYDIYYRGKNKTQVLANIKYLSDALDRLTTCNFNGEPYVISLQFTFEYLGKDSEGYFVFASVLHLL